MKTAILSPHTDDAIFSLGDYMQSLDDVTIVTPFAGIPSDPTGMKKHITLRKEHESACDLLDVDYINGQFLDDVYTPRPEAEHVIAWLEPILAKFDTIIAPIGIHHPDHIFLRNLLMEKFKIHRFYAELPYAVLYPDEVRKLKFLARVSLTHTIARHTERKRQAVMCYDSQLQNNYILGQILQPEEIYD